MLEVTFSVDVLWPCLGTIDNLEQVNFGYNLN